MSMQMKYLDATNLACVIEEAFPLVDMPSSADLIAPGFSQYNYLAEELERYRGKEISGDAIRIIHQDLSHLSASAWHWILPHYLRFCLTAEAEYNRMETEFLIYNLGPDLRFQADVVKRLSQLTNSQISCLIDFLGWCLSQEYWREYCPDSIARGIGFLQTVLVDRQHQGHH